MKPRQTPFSRLLIANRGEIALRIMRTAKCAGLETVAVHTDADADAPYVAFADQAVRIGAGPVGDSYLDGDKLLAAAKASGADALHPGYGFLSENADFAAAVMAAGLVFVGPTAEAIAAMGNKAAAKRLMQAAGVPCLPGYEGADQTDEALGKAAKSIGMPLMVKAAAGGGGRGMRLVQDPAELPRALADARTEAVSAFGSAQLILERAITNARHVEIQILADRHGNTIHLGERDCSIQRRHQKVVEESPSPAVDAELRAKMGQAAVNAARAIGYEGAGTVEFLLDQAGEFYFLEMNTRLQVEHPVSELVTGIDLVDLQLKVAAGQPLGLRQDDIHPKGHAIEARLYAEDPARGFLPDSGKIIHWQPPRGDGIRVDSGIAEGFVVSPYYDPMLAKIIAYGPDRETARKRLIAALAAAPLFGPRNNRDFLIDVLSSDGFASGKATTGFLGETFEPALPEADFATLATLAALAFADAQETAEARSLSSPDLSGWGSPGALNSRLAIRHQDQVLNLELTLRPDGELTVRSNDNSASARFRGDSLYIDGKKRQIVAFCRDDARYFLADQTRTHRFHLNRPTGNAADSRGGSRLIAPMHGSIRKILVKPGERVEKGSRLLVLEAMKMQHELLAEVAGTITAVTASEGQQVAIGAALITIEPDRDETS